MPMKDGFRTLINFAFMNNVQFAEVSVKPGGLDGRGPIDITSMRNSKYVTKWPKQLRDFTPVTSDCQWNPALLAQLNQFVLLINQRIDVTMPTGDILSFYGWCDKADPQPQKEGEVPIIQFTLIPSNLGNGGAEQPPLLNGVPF